MSRPSGSAAPNTNRVVWRYPIAIVDVQTIAMPAGAMTLCVARREGAMTTNSAAGTTHDAVDMWALVDPSAPMVDRTFRVVGTGHPVSLATEVLEHLGSVQILKGRLVFHVFEVVNAQD